MHTRVNRVGLLACAVGLTGLLAVSFGALAPFRIAAGVSQGLFEALPVHLAWIPLALWTAILSLSVFGGRSRVFGLARGWLAVLELLAVLWLVGVAAKLAIAPGDTVARYRIGGGAWVSMLSAFALVMASRRAPGAGSRSALLMSLAVPGGILVLLVSGSLGSLGMVAEYRNVREDFWQWVGLHLVLAGAALLAAVVVATSLGVLSHRHRRLADPIFTVTSVFQTIPGLAMIGILAVPLGVLTVRFPGLRSLGIGRIGWAPVVLALTLYALLVIARNTYSGLNSVPEATVDAARGMGLSGSQVLRKVELPLAAPVVFSGIRTAVQQTIGNATLGVFVAAATLGRPIFGGVSQTADDLTLLGSVTLVVLAVTADITFRGLERFLTPRHLAGGRR